MQRGALLSSREYQSCDHQRRHAAKQICCRRRVYDDQRTLRHSMYSVPSLGFMGSSAFARSEGYSGSPDPQFGRSRLYAGASAVHCAILVFSNPRTGRHAPFIQSASPQNLRSVPISQALNHRPCTALFVQMAVFGFRYGVRHQKQLLIFRKFVEIRRKINSSTVSGDTESG